MHLSESPPLTPFLRKLETRSTLTDEERQAILGLPAHARQVHANHDFVALGERVTHCSFVFEGIVGTFGQSRKGLRQITSIFIAGDMIDLQSVVLPEAMSALQALTPTVIFQVPHAAVRQIGHRFPNIAEAFWRECVADAAIINEWVVNIGRRDARTRMAHLFCEIACRLGAARAKSFTFGLPITQYQLSDMLGLTPVHVNRTLKALRNDGVLEISGRRVEILDWDRLVKIGDFDATYLQLGVIAANEEGNCDTGMPLRLVG